MSKKVGTKKLTNVGRGSKVNQFGVKFTASEIKALRNEVQKVNARAKSYENQMKKIRVSSGNAIDSRIPIEPLYNKKSASLQGFKSREDFKAYMSRLKRQGSDKYLNYRYEVEKSNFKDAIRSTFAPKEANELIKKVNKIPAKNLHNAFIGKKLEHTGYVYYDPEKTKYFTLINQLDSL